LDGSLESFFFDRKYKETRGPKVSKRALFVLNLLLWNHQISSIYYGFWLILIVV